MRSRLVSRENLKILAMKIGIDEMLKNNAGPGSYRSMYGDAFEAYIGAIYLDQGYKTTQQYILSKIIRPHVDLEEVESTEKNFKSIILNWGQKEKHVVQFDTVDDDAKSRLITIRLTIDGEEKATAQDFVKKKAEQIAAEKVCKELGLL